jgi:integrase
MNYKEIISAAGGNFSLISNRKRQPYTPDGFSSLWDRWRRRALAAKVIVQNFNDTDIRAASSADVETLEEAARLLGHASPQTTQRHYRRRPAKVRPIR